MTGEANLFAAIPGAEVFPEGVSSDTATGNFYVGSTSDGTLYATRNSFGEIVRVALSDDLRTGSTGTAITSALFIYQTAIAYTGSGFLVANSQFNNRGGSPVTRAEVEEYTVDPLVAISVVGLVVRLILP